MPEKLRERILEICGALTTEQQQLMIEFIWLRAHCPQAPGERTQKRLMQLLDTAGIESSGITDALKGGVDELRRAISGASDDDKPGRS